MPTDDISKAEAKIIKSARATPHGKLAEAERKTHQDDRVRRDPNESAATTIRHSERAKRDA